MTEVDGGKLLVWKAIWAAANSDKDAAARVADRLKPSSYTGPAATTFEGWMQFAAELGNGIAAFDLARYYNVANRGALAGLSA